MNKPVDINNLVDRFLTWPLPESVCADLCATKQQPGRFGTNLLDAIEAKQMIEYLFAAANLCHIIADQRAEIERLQRRNAELKAELAAARRERDEARAFGEKAAQSYNIVEFNMIAQEVIERCAALYDDAMTPSRKEYADAIRKLSPANIRAEWEKKCEDAERYRWLRSVSALDPQRHQPPDDEDWWMNLGDKLDEDFDADIDAARGKK